MFTKKNGNLKMVSESVYLHYLSSLLDGDKEQCTQIVNALLDREVTVKEIYLRLFQRSLYRIGELWEKERCTIAEEHIATKITESLVDLVVARMDPAPKEGKSALITCIDKEYHELGARMVANFFEINGWHTNFLGSNTPRNEIISHIKKRRPNVLGISNNFYINFLRLLKLIDELQKEFPDLDIIVGGQALTEGKDELFKRFPKVKYLESLNDLEEYIETYK
ncbi:MAG: cobalamin-dependent protein [Ignavibacteriaceae bacterium]|nr:cobalamin-dependent protein [Ignavibacteriaceae bacterium]